MRHLTSETSILKPLVSRDSILKLFILNQKSPKNQHFFNQHFQHNLQQNYMPDSFSDIHILNTLCLMTFSPRENCVWRFLLEKTSTFSMHTDPKLHISAGPEEAKIPLSRNYSRVGVGTTFLLNESFSTHIDPRA